ncbi:hypothetical protein PF007_g26124 [Phytophthora fragariae]|uniref:SWIM-type domain-containing protein n=1 Tax=Phytophthora fragariae TaxID=53985 RepID=A0A6A3QAW2_9STRA|nr:hypothetical protein PF007_g26124 [Phytophthora fragariae]
MKSSIKSANARRKQQENMPQGGWIVDTRSKACHCLYYFNNGMCPHVIAACIFAGVRCPGVSGVRQFVRPRPQTERSDNFNAISAIDPSLNSVAANEAPVDSVYPLATSTQNAELPTIQNINAAPAVRNDSVLDVQAEDVTLVLPRHDSATNGNYNGAPRVVHTTPQLNQPDSSPHTSATSACPFSQANEEGGRISPAKPKAFTQLKQQVVHLADSCARISRNGVVHSLGG